MQGAIKMNNKKNISNIEKKGIVLVTALFTMMILGILMVAVSLRMQKESQGTQAQRDTTICLYTAEAGLEACVDMLRTSPAWRTGFLNEPLQDIDGNNIGFYTVTFGPDNTTTMPPWVIIPVQAIGQLAAGDTAFQRTINADIITANPAQFFAFIDDKAVISNGANITGGSLYARELEFNINPLFGDLIISEPTFYIQGYGYTVNDPNPSSSPNVIFNERPRELPYPVAFPGVNAGYYKQIAQSGGRYYDGDRTFDDGIALGVDENGVIFVDGNVFIKGDVKAPVAVVATGNIHITGDITWLLDESDNPIGKLGLFATGDIIIPVDAPDDISIRAQIITNGIFKTEGEKGSKNNFIFDGSMSVQGKTGSLAVDLTTYGNRRYNYDQALTQAPAIPFTTFVANIHSWQEAQQEG